MKLTLATSLKAGEKSGHDLFSLVFRNPTFHFLFQNNLEVKPRTVTMEDFPRELLAATFGKRLPDTVVAAASRYGRSSYLIKRPSARSGSRCVLCFSSIFLTFSYFRDIPEDQKQRVPSETSTSKGTFHYIQPFGNTSLSPSSHPPQQHQQ